jgi:hypothetical protein
MRLVKDRVLHAWRDLKADAKQRVVEVERRQKAIQEKARPFGRSVPLRADDRHREVRPTSRQAPPERGIGSELCSPPSPPPGWHRKKPRCGGRDTGRDPGGVSSSLSVQSSSRASGVPKRFQERQRRRLLIRLLDLRWLEAHQLARVIGRRSVPPGIPVQNSSQDVSDPGSCPATSPRSPPGGRSRPGCHAFWRAVATRSIPAS